MDTLESGAQEAPAQNLPQELAMVTSLKGEAINPEPGWRQGGSEPVRLRGGKWGS